MRGDQLAGKWAILQVNEARPNGQSDSFRQEETGRTIYRALETPGRLDLSGIPRQLRGQGLAFHNLKIPSLVPHQDAKSPLKLKESIPTSNWILKNLKGDLG